MNDFSWFKFYPTSVPKEVDCTAYTSVAALFEESVAKYGSSVAYECMGKTLSFQELDRMSAHFASYLTQELKLAKGCRDGGREYQSPLHPCRNEASVQ